MCLNRGAELLKYYCNIVNWFIDFELTNFQRRVSHSRNTWLKIDSLISGVRRMCAP